MWIHDEFADRIEKCKVAEGVYICGMPVDADVAVVEAATE